MGVSAVEERRVVILTSGVLEFMEELDSAETWIQNAKTDVILAPPEKPGGQPEPSQMFESQKGRQVEELAKVKNLGPKPLDSSSSVLPSMQYQISPTSYIPKTRSANI